MQKVSFQGEKPSSLETQKLTRAPWRSQGMLQGDPRRSPRGSRVDACRSLRLRTMPGGEPVPGGEVPDGDGLGVGGWGNGPRFF